MMTLPQLSQVDGLAVLPIADGFAIEELHGFDALADRLAVSTGVAVDGGAGPARDARHGLHAGESAIVGEVDERVQFGTRGDGNGVGIGGYTGGAVAQNGAGIAVIADN